MFPYPENTFQEAADGLVLAWQKLKIACLRGICAHVAWLRQWCIRHE